MTVSFVVCLVYGIRKNFPQTPAVEGIEALCQGLNCYHYWSTGQWSIKLCEESD